MKSINSQSLATRRDFLRQSLCASLGATGVVNALAHLRLMTAAMGQASPASGYKALVCLFLSGGNDANNLLVPGGSPGSNPLRGDYENGRGVLAIPSASLQPLNIRPGSQAFTRHHQGQISPMGVHPSAAALANLFNAGELAFVCNVGTLCYPIPSRQDFLNRTIPVPIQLFSHEDQQIQWQSSISDRPFASGWGGRAAELLHDSYNNATSSKVSMAISLSGINSFQVGTTGDVVQFVVNPSGVIPLLGFDSVGGDNNPYDAALNPDGTYKITDQGKCFKGFEEIMRMTHDNLHEEAYNHVVSHARTAEGAVGAAITAAATSGVDIDSLFSAASSRLGDQLKMITKLIAGRSVLGNNRQIFFCQIDGYDNHDTLLGAQVDLYNELSQGMQTFRDALQALGVWNDVAVFTASDFGRRFAPNSPNPATAGADHAWGGHAMVMGGAVRGGDLYGHFPSLKMDSSANSIDVGGGSWIPDTSVDQYSAVLASWMGVGSSEMEAIFPNLPRFDNPLAVASTNLSFI